MLSLPPLLSWLSQKGSIHIDFEVAVKTSAISHTKLSQLHPINLPTVQTNKVPCICPDISQPTSDQH